jgi:biotin transporter BioY
MGFLAGMAAAAWVVRPRSRADWRAGLPLTPCSWPATPSCCAVGWAGLASVHGPGPAFTVGILPFLPGAVVKSLAARPTVRAVKR